MKKYVWLDLNTGVFSNSWSEEDHATDGIGLSTWEAAKLSGWKLIEYTCLNDTDFDFYNKMKIVTNTKS